MKKVKFKNGVIYNVPQSYDELTMRMYIEIQKNGVDDEAAFLAAVCGVTKEEFVKLEDPDADIRIYNELDWFMQQPTFAEIKHPSYIKIGDKKIKIPNDIGYETYEQKVTVTNYLNDKLVDSEIMAYMIAVYLYPKYYEKEFNGDDVLAFMNEYILDLRFMDLYPIGSFFLQNLREYLSSKIAFYQKNMNQTKSKQESKILKNLKSLKQ